MNLQMLSLVSGPKVDLNLWFSVLQDAVKRYGIEEGDEQCAWLANAAHESTKFTSFVESLNYRWDALLNQWPNRFDVTTAVRVGRVDTLVEQGGKQGVMWNGHFVPTTKHKASEAEIANIAYGGRNGNVATDDGWRYRGRGAFQLTFLGNYRAYEAASGNKVVANPDLLLQPAVAADSAAWFWAKFKNLGPVLKARGFDAACIAINGGRNGLEDRQAMFRKLRAVKG